MKIVLMRRGRKLMVFCDFRIAHIMKLDLPYTVLKSIYRMIKSTLHNNAV